MMLPWAVHACESEKQVIASYLTLGRKLFSEVENRQSLALLKSICCTHVVAIYAGARLVANTQTDGRMDVTKAGLLATMKALKCKTLGAELAMHIIVQYL